MSFDGSCSSAGSRAGVSVSNSRNNHVEGHSYKLNFQLTNKIGEYGALILGLQLFKKSKMFMSH